MRKNVFFFGLISGFIISTLMIWSVLLCYNKADFEGNVLLGYASMLLAFSLIFIEIKNQRDKINNGLISFGKAFKIGLYITLIASTVYVAIWLFAYYLFIPDFMDKYTDHVLRVKQKSGATPSEMQKEMASMEEYKEMYKNPLLVIVFTYLEVFPIGLIITIVSALILKRKRKKEDILPV